MLDLTRKEEILLYHGSFLPVPIIDLNKCQEGKDFGKGFYLTTSYTQAQNFIPMSIKKQHCFLTYNALQCLQYLGSDEYDIRNK